MSRSFVPAVCMWLADASAYTTTPAAHAGFRFTNSSHASSVLARPSTISSSTRTVSPSRCATTEHIGLTLKSSAHLSGSVRSASCSSMLVFRSKA